MIVDVIIPFQSRPELLRRCIESVRKAKVRTQHKAKRNFAALVDKAKL